MIIIYLCNSNPTRFQTLDDFSPQINNLMQYLKVLLVSNILKLIYCHSRFGEGQAVMKMQLFNN
jgi:hypothetical protein